MNDFSSVITAGFDGVNVTLPVRQTVNVHLKEGTIIPY